MDREKEVLKIIKAYLSNSRKSGTSEIDSYTKLLDALVEQKKMGGVGTEHELFDVLKEVLPMTNKQKFKILTFAAQDIIPKASGEIVETDEYRNLMIDISKEALKRSKSIIDITAGIGTIAGQIYFESNNLSITTQELNSNLKEIQDKLFLICDIKAVTKNVNSLLKTEGLEEFDLVIFTPPYGPERFDTKEINMKELEDRKIKSLSMESAFILKAIDYAKKGGLIATSVPASFLFNTLNEEIRKIILEKTDVLAIIELPRKMLNSSAVNTAFLVLRKKDGNYKPKELLAASLADKVIGEDDYTKEKERLLTEWREFLKEELQWL